jgi:hypothetical protein
MIDSKSRLPRRPDNPVYHDLQVLIRAEVATVNQVAISGWAVILPQSKKAPFNGSKTSP